MASVLGMNNYKISNVLTSEINDDSYYAIK